MGVKTIVVIMVVAGILTSAGCMFFHFFTPRSPLNAGEIALVAAASLVIAAVVVVLLKWLFPPKDRK